MNMKAKIFIFAIISAYILSSMTMYATETQTQEAYSLASIDNTKATTTDNNDTEEANSDDSQESDTIETTESLYDDTEEIVTDGNETNTEKLDDSTDTSDVEQVDGVSTDTEIATSEDEISEEQISDTDDLEEQGISSEGDITTGGAEYEEQVEENQYVGSPIVPDYITDEITYRQSEVQMPIDIISNNKYLSTDTEGLILFDRTYLPIRTVVEAFGFEVIEWDQESYVATISNASLTIQFLVNTNQVILNGELIEMDTPTLVVDGRTMVPVRFISEQLGFEVEWDSVYYTVILTHPTYVLDETKLQDRFYTYGEMQIFSKLVYREAGSVSYETMHGVASVVMNHYHHDYFENTIYNVIYEVNNNGSLQFVPAHDPLFYKTVPNHDSVLAVKWTLRGENSVGDCLFFNTSPFRGRTIYKVVDGVYFCY